MVAAWRLRMKIRRSTIVPAGDYSGKVEHESPLRGIKLDIDGSDRAEMKAGKAVLILLAGPAAQRRFRPSSWRHYHGNRDHEIAVDLALRLHGDGEMATAYLKWMGLQADRLVKVNWPIVTLFAENLLRENSLDQTRIEAIVNAEIQSRSRA
jgi:hypothetical protein